MEDREQRTSGTVRKDLPPSGLLRFTEIRMKKGFDINMEIIKIML